MSHEPQFRAATLLDAPEVSCGSRILHAPPRILQVVLSLAPGGTERLVIEVTKRLHPRLNTLVCCLDDRGAWAGELMERGVEVVSLSRRPGFHPALGWQIAKVAARHQADVLHCHHYSPFVYGCLAALQHRRLRVIFTEHGQLVNARPSLRRTLVNPWLARVPDTIVAVSADLRDRLIEQGFPPERVDVIYNGIDPGPTVTDMNRRRARDGLGIASDAFVIGTVARLDPVKDLDMLLDAFALFRASDETALLLIVGDGPARGALEERARELGVAPAVRFQGYRQDARSLLPALDLYVNSSLLEGISLTILEAMAASLPVVATRAGGTPEVIRHEESGLLVPPRGPIPLARAMTTLACQPGRRLAIGRMARERILADFTLNRMIAQYAQVYCGPRRS